MAILPNTIYRFNAAAADAKSFQSCLTLCNPIDGSPPGSPVPGILQARTLEWVAISFSRFNAIPIKLPMAFFTELKQKNFTIHMETQNSLKSRSSLEKAPNGAGGINFPDFRLYYKL